MTGPIGGPPPDDHQRPAGQWGQLPPELDPRGPRRRGPDGPNRPGGPARPGEPGIPKRRRTKRIVAWIAGGLAVLLALGAVTGWATINHFLGNIKKINVFAGDNNRPGGGVRGDLNVLVVGSDSRAGLSRAQQRELHVGHDLGQRSDTMILLHIPRGGGKAVLISLPRDSYVKIPAYTDSSHHFHPAAYNKLNAAYSLGGAPLAVRTVEQNTHVRIDHYIEINFLGFVKMVDALGGVNVCTPTAINDPVHYDRSTGGYVGSGLRLPAGRSHVDGTQALEYVRAREFDPSADIGRIKRQQKFMSALMQKAESTGTLLNPKKLYDFIDAVTGSLTTDQDFGLAQIKRLASKLRSTSPSHVQLLTVPLSTSNGRALIGGGYASVVKWDPVLAPQLFGDISADRPINAADEGKSAAVTIPPSSVGVRVLNATQTQGFAHQVADDLATLGFHTSAGNAPAGSDPKQVVVRYGANRADSARTVAAAIPGATLQADPTAANTLEVLVGSNFHGVQRVTVSPSASSSPGLDVRTAAQDVCA